MDIREQVIEQLNELISDLNKLNDTLENVLNGEREDFEDAQDILSRWSNG